MTQPFQTFTHVKSGKLYVQACGHDVDAAGKLLVRSLKDGKPFGPVRRIHPSLLAPTQAPAK